MRVGAAGPRALRLAVRLLAAAGLIAFLLSVPLVTDGLMALLQTVPPILPDQVGAAGTLADTAIVILSAGRRHEAPEYGGETVDGLTLERLRYGARLARATGLPVLVTGGLATAHERSLADLMAETLAGDYGIEPRWREERSTNTMENARFSAALLRREGIGRVLLVTHGWHMRRALAAFRASGLTVLPAPTAFYGTAPDASDLVPSMAALRMSGYAVHELVGGLWYRLRYGVA